MGIITRPPVANLQLSDRYKRAFKFTVQWEVVFAPGHDGDYNFVISENDPSDPGGLTKYGVDQRSFPHVDIKNLDYNEAEFLYYDKTWKPCCCEQLEDGTGEVIFDIGVNNGNREAILLLQRAINMEHPSIYIIEDGYIGPKTIAAANSMPAHQAVLDLFAKRKWYYAYIAYRNGKLMKFLKGWNNRNQAVETFAYQLAQDDIFV